MNPQFPRAEVPHGSQPLQPIRSEDYRIGNRCHKESGTCVETTDTEVQPRDLFGSLYRLAASDHKPYGLLGGPRLQLKFVYESRGNEGIRRAGVEQRQNILRQDGKLQPY